MLCLRVGGCVDDGFPSSDALVLRGERGRGGAGRIIVLDDPAGAFAIRWVLALLGWADANVFWGRGGVARSACSAWDGGRWALRRMGGLDHAQSLYHETPHVGPQAAPSAKLQGIESLRFGSHFERFWLNFVAP